MASSKNTFQVNNYKVSWSKSFEVWQVKTLSGRLLGSFKYKLMARQFAEGKPKSKKS